TFTASGGVFYSWNNGATTSAISINTAGTYTVRLAVASGSSCSNTFTDTIRVYPQATVAFSINNDKQCLKANQKFIFTNASTIASGSISSYNWTTGDGKSSSRSDTIQHTYSKDGTFTVSLFTSSNFGCKDTLNKTAIVYPMPVVSFTINNASQCLKGNAFAFTDKTTINSPGSITSRNWSFGDKKKSTSTLTNPSFTYDTATSFSVKLISTSTSGCKDSATQTVNVRPMPKSIFVSRTRDTQCLSGNKFTFSDTSTISSGSYTRLWMFGDGKTSTAQPASNTYATDGIYTVKLALNSNYNCKDTTSKPIVVYPMPVAQIGYKSTSLCEKQDTGVFSVISSIKYGTIKTKKWYFGDGTTDT
ncbi:MAG: PKD domain-containing protein, partial [Bacteroidetes bacterium]|nr:PKD domain-containing protein [Bacteroidota bacterium]